jgi:hypothetical protein
MEQAFGHNFSFPTNRRPVNYRRPLISPVSEEAEAWLEASGITIGELPQPQRDQALQLPWTWKDILPRTCDLASDRSDLSPQPDWTRLQASAIKPTVVNGRRGGMAAGADSSDGQGGHHRSGRLTMECAIQIRAEKEQFVAAYTYVLPGKRRRDQIKPSDATSGADPQYSHAAAVLMFWWTDASNRYWAVPVWPPHLFKTAFSCALGQFA